MISAAPITARVVPALVQNHFGADAAPKDRAQDPLLQDRQVDRPGDGEGRPSEDQELYVVHVGDRLRADGDPRGAVPDDRLRAGVSQ